MKRNGADGNLPLILVSGATMPILVTCPGCDQRFRVPDSTAGRHIRCPKCSGVISVQAEPASKAGDASNQPDQWWVKTDGETYGPVAKAELDEWVQEGRLDKDSQVRPEGDEQWRRAAELYPELSE